MPENLFKHRQIRLMLMRFAVCSYNAGRRRRGGERSFFIFPEKSSKCWRKYLHLVETINTALHIVESSRERWHKVSAIIFRRCATNL